MRKRDLANTLPGRHALLRLACGALLFVIFAFMILLIAAIRAEEGIVARFLGERSEQAVPEPFPVGVDPNTRSIVEIPLNESAFAQHLARQATPHRQEETLLARAVRIFSESSLYQQLASPASRIVVIYAGERKEEVVEHFGDILGWSSEERERFASLVTQTLPVLEDGKFLPGRYVLAADTPPEAAAAMLIGAFNDDILEHYTEAVSEKVPLPTALTLASLLEREAYTFTDMRRISGVIWNRIFADQPLQIDATLQYAKGSRPYGPWWPQVRPNDKFIDSPFNTYQNDGLPPAPIANPSVAAVLAALNPAKTECRYYFHDAQGNFHCAATYNEHVGLLKRHYGAGR